MAKNTPDRIVDFPRPFLTLLDMGFPATAFVTEKVPGASWEVLSGTSTWSVC